MCVARARLLEFQRGEVRRSQTEAWRHASEIRSFIHAVRAREGEGCPMGAGTNEWLAWAEEHADSIDPILGPLLAPDPSEPTRAALEPFLTGWSPYGFDQRTVTAGLRSGRR